MRWKPRGSTCSRKRRMNSCAPRVMVEASDEMICIGGGSIARDEYMTAEKLNKSVRFEEADMNHAWAVEKARRKGEPEPRDFRGLLHEYLEQR